MLFLTACAPAPGVQAPPPSIVAGADPAPEGEGFLVEEGLAGEPLVETATEPLDESAPEPVTDPIAASEPQRSGFLAFLRRPNGKDAEEETPEPAVLTLDPEAEDETDALAPPGDTSPTAFPTAEIDQPARESSPDPSSRPQLFGFLNRRVPGEVRAPASDGDADVIAAAAPPPDTRAAGGPAADLPFGEVVRVCGLKRRERGTEVDRTEGGSGFTLYDTDPTSTQPRTQFISGFKDGCARQFTASLALFGSAKVHEATRYNPLNTKPYSETDAAYERVKNRICRVRDGQPCPEARAGRLDSQTAFVSVYRGFGDTGLWLEMFLHKGELVAYQTLTR